MPVPPSSRSRRLALASALVALVLPAAGSAGGLNPGEPEQIDDPLLPIPTLLAPMGRARSKGPPPTPCDAAPLPMMAERLPFGPGEKLDYDVRILGLTTGKVSLAMDERAEIDGVPVYPVRAWGRTEGFSSFLGEVDVRMVSWVEPGGAKPVRMANRARTHRLFGDEIMVREDAAFSGRGQVAGYLRWWKKEKDKMTKARREAAGDLVDVLSLVYYGRSRVYDEGSPFCFEVYHRRLLWRIEGRVGGLEVVKTPWATREARRIDASIRRVLRKGPEREARTVQVYVTDDEDRIPLLARTEDGLTSVEGALRVYAPGRKLRHQGVRP